MDIAIASAYGVNPVPLIKAISDIELMRDDFVSSFSESIATVLSIPRKGLLWGYSLSGEPVESEVRAIRRLKSLR